MKKIICLCLGGLLVLGIGGLSFAMMCGGHSGGGDHSGRAEAAETSPSAQMAAVDAGNKICPVSGEKITEEGKVTYEYKGKIYNFCCPECIDDFKKNPEEYIKKIEEEGAEEHEGHSGHQHH